jgi:beta-galactosidase
MGCNAYRTSHNDPTPELLEACDRLGMLVMDEHRKMGASPEILGELERLILRDRNHPSVILWSIGNEEFAIQGTEVGAQVAAAMRDVVRRLDPTRPVTVAMNGGWGRGFSTVIDVQGCNYFRSGGIDPFHQAHPLQPLFGSEEASTVSTRGIYANDREKGYVSAYDVNAPPWGSTAEQWWTYFAARPFLAGAFVWTGFDYRGEPTPYS